MPYKYDHRGRKIWVEPLACDSAPEDPLENSPNLGSKTDTDSGFWKLTPEDLLLKQKIYDLGGVRGGDHVLHEIKNGCHNNFHDRDRMFDATQTLLELFHYFGSNRIDVFPVLGTLLGVIRDGSIIPHDDDLDLGFMEEDTVAVKDAIDDLSSRGFYLVHNRGNTRLTIVKRRILVDLYPYRSMGKVFRQVGNENKNIALPDALPLKKIDFKDQTILCFNSPESVLDNFYGDWKRPR